ncbi:MAG TPA: RNA polymerase sigma factor, partial [Xanthomonadales bacterium]|nr:RNA polymerase sigma factor [Xanthomonadales bacterium]
MKFATGSTMIVLEYSNPRPMTDHATAAIALRGRLDSFLRTIERRALRMAQLAVGDLDDALELVQDSMLGFVKSYGDKAESDWSPLFWRVLDSRIQDHHRRQSVRRRWRVFFKAQDDGEEERDPLAEIADPVGAGPLDRMQGSEAARAIDAALRALPDRQRQAFLLRIWEGFDVAATAQVMGCSEGSVKTHLFR